MTKTSPFKPTHMQLQAVDFLEKFMKSPEIACTLAGYAGTGKTSLLKYYIQQRYNRVTVVTAFTHKAVINISRGTGLPGKTVHSLLGLQPNMKLERFNPHNPTFTIQGLELISKYRIVVIDECSQIGTDLYDYLIDRAYYFKVKLIFVGDPCQLPPINEYISKSFKIKDVFWLTEILRQKENNPLLDLLTVCREDVLNKDSKTLTYLMKNTQVVNESGEGFTVLGKKDFNEVFLKLSKDNKDADKYRYVAYTRNSTDNFNYHVHKSKHGYNNAPKLMTNDILTAHTTLVDDFMTPILVNSLDYTVNETLEFSTDDGIEVYATRLEDNLTHQLLLDTFLIVKHTEDNIRKLYDILLPMYQYAMECKGQARKVAWVEYFKIKNRYLLMFDVELEGLRLEKDISYGYGLTTYKSQGSTYTNTFINMNDICCYNGKFSAWITNTKYRPNAIDLRNKHLYVALSRTSHHNYILFGQ